MAERQIKPQSGPQTKFLESEADIVIYGGAAYGGKTYALLLEPLRNIHNPGFGAVVFRRTSPQIRNEGGLWDEAANLYPLIGGEPKSTLLEWNFPSGAKVKMAHMQYEQDKLNWQGAQIALIEFDELTHFSESQFFYMLSRNRSTCGVRPYVRATCNPDADSWVAQFIAWWIGEDGLPIQERAGILRWFVRKDGKLLWADTREELAVAGEMPKSVTFIPASINDNKIGLSKDPNYFGNLMALPLVERERLLHGNWKIKAQGGNVFRRDWFADKILDEIPTGPECWFWDRAATQGDGDYTVGVNLIVSQGKWFVKNVIREQLSALARNSLIRAEAINSRSVNSDLVIGAAQDPGSAGKYEAEEFLSMIGSLNIAAKSEPETGSKLVRAQPFAAQCEAGNVYLKKGPWNEAYIEELVQFPDGPYDDQVDASSGAFKLSSVSRTPIVATAQFEAYEALQRNGNSRFSNLSSRR